MRHAAVLLRKDTLHVFYSTAGESGIAIAEIRERGDELFDVD
jgi:hypothetical protein